MLLRSFCRVVVLCVTIVLLCSTTRADITILRVDGINGSDAGDGSAWGEKAFLDLQHALDLAELILATGPIGDQVHVWVATGVYKPSELQDPFYGERTSTFLFDFNNVQMYGGFAGNETSQDQRNPMLNETILSGDIDDDGLLDSCIEDEDPNDLSIPFGGAANGNIDDDPLFEMQFFNYRLDVGSPCIDKGLNASLPTDVVDLDEDGNVTEEICCDLDMTDRRKPGGGPVFFIRVDMGAYEH